MSDESKASPESAEPDNGTPSARRWRLGRWLPGMDAPAHVLVLWFLVIVAFAFALRASGIHSRSIWNDEDHQARRSLVGPFGFALPLESAVQEQPPLDYLLESIALRNFGVTEVGARITAALTGSLAAGLLFFLLRSLTRNGWIAILGALLLAVQPMAVRYGHEGRPISTGVFFSVATLWCIYLALSEERFDLRRFLFMMAIQTLFLLSTGLQPVVFLASTSLALVPFLAVRPLRLRILGVWGSAGLALLLASPLLWVTVEAGRPYLKLGDSSAVLTALMDATSLASFKECGSFINSLFEGWWPAFVGLLVLAVIGWRMTRRRDGYDRFQAQFAVFLLLVLVLFPFIFTVVFNSLVRWAMNARYYLTYATIIITGLALGAYFARPVIAALFARHKVLGMATGLLMGMLFAHGLYSWDSKLTALAAYRGHNWEGLYALFQKEQRPSSAYLINLVPPKKFSPGFYSMQFYYDSGPRKTSLGLYKNLLKDLKKPRIWEDEGSVFLVFHYGAEKITPETVRGIPDVESHFFPGLTTLRITSRSNKRAAVLSALQSLRDRLPKDQGNFRLAEVLAKNPPPKEISRP
jgi:4-amino-4-deoxy-L-arabinose transferase-like glycosyltransferase